MGRMKEEGGSWEAVNHLPLLTHTSLGFEIRGGGMGWGGGTRLSSSKPKLIGDILAVLLWNGASFSFSSCSGSLLTGISLRGS